ncbi:MAG: N-acetylneuraminate synthase [Candidatus Omnitrophica bacterium]|nr:N-acetylneuraminate synthase [Candidatus Omnitrophota bacterium]
MVAPVEIAGRKVGPGHPCFIIAEAGVNHNGDLGVARRLVDAAVQAGADAVKFQSFRADRLATAAAPKARYQLETTRRKESQQEMLRRLELSEEDHRGLLADCRSKGILFLSSPFDEESAEFLARLPVAAFKIPSGEITNLPFLKQVAGYGRPMILSTGMSDLKEVKTAVETIRAVTDGNLLLLHCVSAYPASASDANLRAMETMRRAFGVPVGYSDHTEGISVALAAAALGACVIEKHFTLDRGLPGPDHRASLEPEELAALVRSIRDVEAALGEGGKAPRPCEMETAAVARKSLVAARDIQAGSRLTEESVAAKRPGTGLPPFMRDRVIGRRAARDISEGTLLTLEMLQ